jgi:hypothetical protein
MGVNECNGLESIDMFCTLGIKCVYQMRYQIGVIIVKYLIAQAYMCLSNEISNRSYYSGVFNSTSLYRDYKEIELPKASLIKMHVVKPLSPHSQNNGVYSIICVIVLIFTFINY